MHMWKLKDPQQSSHMPHLAMRMLTKNGNHVGPLLHNSSGECTLMAVRQAKM